METSGLDRSGGAAPSTNHQSGSDGGNGLPNKILSVHEFQAQINELCSMHMNKEQKRLELCQRANELRERRGAQHESLLQSQMILEAISNKLQDEVAGHAAQDLQVHQASCIALSLQRHCDNVNQTLDQASQINDDLMNRGIKCIQRFNVTTEKNRDLQIRMQEIERVQLEIQQAKAQQQQINDSLTERCNNRTRHQNFMAEIKRKNSAPELECEKVQLSLEAMRGKNEILKKDHGKVLQQKDQKIDQLQCKLNIQCEKDAKAKATSAVAMEERASIIAEKETGSQELKDVNDKNATLEKNRMESLRRREDHIKQTLEIQFKKKGIIEDLEMVQLQTAKLKINLSDRRAKAEDTVAKGKSKIYQAEEDLRKSKSVAEAQIAGIEQHLAFTRQAINTKMEKCHSMKESISIKEEDVQKLKRDEDTVQSAICLLKSQLDGKIGAVKTFSCELQGISNSINGLKEKISEIEKLILQLQTEGEESIQSLLREVDQTKQQTATGKESIVEKTKEVNLLAHQRDMIKSKAKAVEKSTDEKIAQRVVKLESERERLFQQKLRMEEENQIMLRECHLELTRQSDLLANKEKAIIELSICSEKVVKELQDYRNTEVTLQSDFEMKAISERELKLPLKNLKEEVQRASTKVNEGILACQNACATVRNKTIELNNLREEVAQLENNQNATEAKLSEDRKRLMEDIKLCKQDCEGLSSRIHDAEKEFDELKRQFIQIQNEREATSSKSKKLSDKKTKEYKFENERIQQEIENLQKQEKDLLLNFQHLRQDTEASKKSYRRLQASIEAAKLAKQGKKFQRRPQDNSANSSNISSDLVVNVPSGENHTPRSILKQASKPPTPQSAKKNVSFCNQVDEVIDSSGSSVLLEPDLVDEIEENPAAAKSIIANRVSNKTE